MRGLVTITVCCTLISPLVAAGSEQVPALDLPAIVSRMEQAQSLNREHTKPYSVVREYRLSGEDTSKPPSQVIAEVSFYPPSQKEYAIQKTDGSGQAEKVVRKVLDHESQMAGQSELAEINSANYSFGYAGQDTIEGHACYVLTLQPRRETKELINGRAWIDASSFLVRRVEGNPAKSPSWWIKDLAITLSYREFQGIWVQYAAEAVAQVRFMGTHVLTSRSLDVRTATAEAKAPAGKPRVPGDGHRPGVLVGAGVFGHR